MGYKTVSGAVADRAQFDQVFEAEDLYHLGQYSGSVYWPASFGFPWMVWFFSAGDSEWATFTVPTDDVVIQIANSDSNDGLVLVYLDGVLVDSVNVNAPNVDPGFYIEVTGIPLGIHTVKVVSGTAPGCFEYYEDDEGYPFYDPCNDLHLDFIAGRRLDGTPTLSGASVSANEGTPAVNVITASDPDGDVLALSASVGTLTPNGDGTWTWTATFPDGPASSEVEITADDGRGGRATTSFAVAVANVPPVIASFSSPLDPVAVGALVTASGAFSDAGVLDTHTATVSWGDGQSTGAPVAEANGSGTFAADHAYTLPGLYTLQAIVTDKDGGSAEAIHWCVVVYSPSSLVTGGGWFESPAGGLASDPTLAAKATFGLVLHYEPGASVPTGDFELHLAGGRLNVKAKQFDWLVVSGTDATFAGTATVDGDGEYPFVATAHDGGDGIADAFSIQVRDAAGTLVYDSGAGLALLGGGNVKIH